MLQDITANDPLLVVCVDRLLAVCKKHPKQLSLIVDAMGTIATLLIIEEDEDEIDEDGCHDLAQRCLKVMVRFRVRIFGCWSLVLVVIICTLGDTGARTPTSISTCTFE